MTEPDKCDRTDPLGDVPRSSNVAHHEGVHHAVTSMGESAVREQGEIPRMPLKINRMKVDPELATEWLGYNTHNRHSRSSIVAAYADAMRQGDWRNDVDPISFKGTLNGKGRAAPVLLNGQHRLHALIAADTTLEFLVVEGLGIDDQIEMDSGVKRQLGDQLRLQGVQNPTEVAAILRLVYGYEHNNLRRRQAISYSTLIRYLASHPELPESVLPARKLYQQIGGRISVFGACHYIISRVDDPSIEEDLDEFLDQLGSGENLAPGSPVLALRNQILALSQPAGPRRRGMNAGQVPLMAIFFKAWNAWRDGSTVQTLSFRGGGKNPEAFPIPA